MTEKLRQITFNYTKLETVIHGADAVACLGAMVEERNHQRVLLLASRTLHNESGIGAQISTVLGDRLAGIFTGIPAHTPRPTVMEILTLAREVKADVLVTVGGGSVIDAAKVVQLALVQGIRNQAELLEFAQFADGSRGRKAGDSSLFREPSAIRQLAIPTTLSGAEHSNNAGVTDVEKSLKEGYRGPDLCPRAIIYDPALCRHTPEWLWLSTAIRSLDHAIEGYCSGDAHSYLDGHFLHAIGLFAETLPVTRDFPDDLEARSLTQQAVWLACCGLGQVHHGASHGVGYLLGAVCGVPHGHTSCVMLPAVLEWNSKVNGARQEAIATALGKSGQSAGQAVRALIGRLGLPQTLQEVGVAREHLPRIAELASRHPVVRRNPRPIDSPRQVMEILELAWR